MPCYSGNYKAVGRSSRLLQILYAVLDEQTVNVIKAVKTKIAVPMHYRAGKRGLARMAEIDDFLKLAGQEPDIYSVDRSIEITPETPSGIYILSRQE